MSIDDTNPYEPTATDPKPPAGPRGSMEYMQSIHYIFESPKWMANILWGSLCILTTQVIPIAGQLVWIGFQFDVVEDKLCRPKKGYPDFDPNRIMDYLVRGFWVFLVTLVVGLVFAPIMLIFFGGVAFVVLGAAAAAGGGEEDAMAIGALVMIALMMLIAFVLSIIMILVITPLTIRAGLTQEFRAAFDMAWVKDFIRKVWLETLIAQLFLSAVGMLAMFLGILALFVGVFPAMAALTLAQGHLYLQLYQLYLARGGQKIPLKPAKPVQPTMSA